MNRALTALVGAVGAVGAAAAAVTGWRRSRHARRDIDYRTVGRVGDGERRQYPAVVVAETVADTPGEASGRLRDYLDGANTSSTTLSPRAPVRTQTEPVAMTTPHHPTSPDSRLRMGVYLGSSFSADAAPQPTNPTVRLTVETPRTLATRSVSRVSRTDRASRASQAMTTLLEQTADADLVAVGSPFVLSYPHRFVPDSLTRTEVAVEVV